MFLIVKSLLVTGAVFNLLCGETDNVVMRKIEDYFQHKVPEVM
jgi:ATP-dependent RNA helicase DDX19/DBP5